MAEAIAQPACPLPLDVLPANFQKHVDPKAPVPLRMMGAKALVPMGPKDMATALFMLTFDADANVGQSVVWRNVDTNVTHTATGTNGVPLTGDIQPGMSSTAQQFPTAGSYPYHCDNHPAETGTVFVTP